MKEQLEALQKEVVDLQALLKKQAEEKGTKEDGTPKMDAIIEAQFAKHRDAILADIDKKMAESKMVKETKEPSKEEKIKNAKLAEFMLKAKLNHPDLVQKTVMSEGTPAQGGYTVPTEVSDMVIGELTNMASCLQKVTMFPHIKGFTRTIPKWLTDLTVYWVGEATLKTTSKPTFTQVSSVIKKLAAIITSSDELLEDNIVGLESLLAKRVARAMANELEKIMFIGDVAGAGDPFNGINKSTIAGTVTQAGATLAYNDIVDAINHASLLEEYRIGAELYMNRTALAAMMKIVDSAGRPLWNLASINGAMSMNALGVPIVISSNITNTCSTSGAASIIVYGNLQNVFMGFKQGNEGMNLLVSQHGVISSGAGAVEENLFQQDETAYRFVLRRGVLVAVGVAFVKIDNVK